MTQRSETNSRHQSGADRASELDMRNPYYLDWMAENVADMKRLVSGQQILYAALAIAFVLGLGLQIAGYIIRSSAPSEPLGLLADLAYALGWSLWTGVVVVVFVEIVPRAKRRQIKQAIDAYEARANHSRAEGGGTARGRDG